MKAQARAAGTSGASINHVMPTRDLICRSRARVRINKSVTVESRQHRAPRVVGLEEKSMRHWHQKWMQTWESQVDDARIEQATWGVVLAATSVVVLRAFI